MTGISLLFHCYTNPAHSMLNERARREQVAGCAKQRCRVTDAGYQRRPTDRVDVAGIADLGFP
jgi:hypothetical protein